MKKIKMFLIILIVLIFILFTHSVSAFSNNQYSIDIPSTYVQISENSFGDEYGRNIDVQIVPFSDSSKGNLYTEEELNNLADNLLKELDKYKDEVKELLIKKNEKYELNLTDDQINEYVDSFKCLGIEKKEITTFSKNNYDCFHIITKTSMGGIVSYANQYVLSSGNNIFTLTFSSDNLSDYNTNEITKAINSFTIKNFKPYKERKTLGEKMIVAVFSSLIFYGICTLIKKFLKK